VPQAARALRADARLAPGRGPLLGVRAAPAFEGGRASFTDLVPAPVDVELAFDAREALRSLAGLGDRRRTALTLKVAGYSYREIQELLGVTFTWINRHITEGRAELRKRERVADAAVEARCR
jgi:DNA-directed RNA polymerase specialized sigma24 family protein